MKHVPTRPKRCPFCQSLPIFVQDPHHFYVGGCRSSGPVCQALRNIVMQSTIEDAEKQWDVVIEPFIVAQMKGRTIREVA